MAATANWTAPTDFPVHGSPRDKLGFAVKLATLASTAQRWQACRFHVSDQFAELSAEPQSAPQMSDATERDAMIHCGTALQHLKLALKRYGCFGRVELFPDLDQPTLAARVHSGSGGTRDEADRELCNALEVKGASLLNPPRLELPASETTLDLLGRALPGERGWLEFARSESSRQRLLELLHANSRVRLKEIRFPNETLVRTPDGAWESAGFTGTTLHERFSRWRKPTLAVKVRPAPALHEPSAPSAPPPTNGTFAVLKTKTDDKHGWLAAGQMLARLLLHTRALGLACVPFLDVLQQPELRAELRTTIGHKGFTQVILQFGAMPPPQFPPGITPAITETGVSI